MLKVYTAAKLHRGKELKDFFRGSSYVILHARWLKHIEIGTPDNEENAKYFWQEDVEDVLTCDVLLVYAGPQGNDILRGALVEVGVALAANKPVFIVGESESYGTWRWHPKVSHRSTLKEVHDALELVVKLRRKT